MGYCIADKVGVPLNGRANFNHRISDFHSENGWVLGEHFAEEFPQVCADIVAIKIAANAKDELVWTRHKSGEITSKAAYEFCRGRFLKVNWGAWLWDSFIPSSRSILMWRLIWGKLPTAEVIAAWGIGGPSICDIQLLFLCCYRNSSCCRSFRLFH